MSIFLRIWFAFAIVLIVASGYMIRALQQYIKPSIRQVVEETLAGNANLIANLLVEDVLKKRVSTPEFDQRVRQVLTRRHKAVISGVENDNQIQALYITNDKGIVIYDSRGLDLGKDYSQWNDVYLTLRGFYGVRSTRSNPDDERTSVMYIGAPLVDNNKIIGVVTLIKPSLMVQPFIDRTRQDMLKQGVVIVLLSLILSALIAWWLRHAIYQVRQYALDSRYRHQITPHFWAARELNELATAIDTMRAELENRAYVEQYVHTLTHELKSPLTAISASAELLSDDLPEKDRMRFSLNITAQTLKLQQLIERLLLLAKLENRHELLTRKSVNAFQLISRVVADRASLIQQKQLLIVLNVPEDTRIDVEEFWFMQALGNVLDNAILFTPLTERIEIYLTETAEMTQIEIINSGEIIPDYALEKVFERFFSLSQHQPAQDNLKKTAHKGTGIGLTLVREIMLQHQGSIQLLNHSTIDQTNTIHTSTSQTSTSQTTEIKQGVHVILRVPKRDSALVLAV